MNDKKTCTFKRITSSEDILKGMEQSKQKMIEEGLWNDNITFEEWSNYAGSHVIITESKE